MRVSATVLAQARNGVRYVRYQRRPVLDPYGMFEWRSEDGPSPEVDFFHKWEIPLDVYKGIGPGPRFVPHNPGGSTNLRQTCPLPSQPVLKTLPPPAAASGTPAPSQAFLRRALVIKGLTNETASPLLAKIHEGALEFANYDLGEAPPLEFLPRTKDLTLSFLSSSTAHTFVQKHLSDPARLYEFTRSPNPTWEWLPLGPVSKSIAEAIKAHAARRGLSITWFDPAHKWQGDLNQFGEFQTMWMYSPCRLIVQFYAMSSAIRAYERISADHRLRVSFFPDLCEMDARCRDMLARHSRKITLDWGEIEPWWKDNWRRRKPPKKQVQPPNKHVKPPNKQVTTIQERRPHSLSNIVTIMKEDKHEEQPARTLPVTVANTQNPSVASRLDAIARISISERMPKSKRTVRRLVQAVTWRAIKRASKVTKGSANAYPDSTDATQKYAGRVTEIVNKALETLAVRYAYTATAADPTSKVPPAVAFTQMRYNSIQRAVAEAIGVEFKPGALQSPRHPQTRTRRVRKVDRVVSTGGYVRQGVHRKRKGRISGKDDETVNGTSPVKDSTDATATTDSRG